MNVRHKLHYRQGQKMPIHTLREVQQQDEEEREEQRGRNIRGTRLPILIDQPKKSELSNELNTRKGEPFSWFKMDEMNSQHEDYMSGRSMFYQPDAMISKPITNNKYQKSTSLNRVHTQVHKHQSPTPNKTIIDPAKESKIDYADRLQRQMFSQKARVSKTSTDRQLRNYKSDSQPKKGEHNKLVPQRGHAKRRPYTITQDESAEELSSANSRDYLAGQPLTFGIFSVEEDPEMTSRKQLPYEQLMHQLYLGIPAAIDHRRQQSTRELCYRLYKNNPLFIKMQYLTCVEMVCNCNIYSLDRGRTIYEVESELICSYIVLWGTVEIYSQEGELQGFYEAGSTLCEEYLLVGAPTKIGEKARAGKRGAGILELSQNSLRTIRHSLSRIQLKKDLIMMESVFKKNFFSKKSIRNSFKYKNNRQPTK